MIFSVRTVRRRWCCSHVQTIQSLDVPNSRTSKNKSGWWYTYPSEKWWSSSVGMMTFPIWWESHKIPYINHIYFHTLTIYLWLTVRKFHGSKPPRDGKYAKKSTLWSSHVRFFLVLNVAATTDAKRGSIWNSRRSGSKSNRIRSAPWRWKISLLHGVKTDMLLFHSTEEMVLGPWIFMIHRCP